MTLTVGSRLGHFEVIAPLGSGGMGEVYRAKDRRLGRDVAIKVITEALGQTTEALERFEREARSIAALSHPGIVSVYEFDRDEPTGIVFIVTELLEGETLRERLGRGALPWRRAAEIAGAIADGLAAAHASGVVHRDLKPENVFLTRDTRVKILDFGLARELRGLREIQSIDATQRKLTDPGMILGTVSYMSPEQVRGETADPRSDIFSLGCILFEMVTASRPFRASTAAETMSAILRDDPPRQELIAREIPSDLIAIVDHCLEKNREDRFQSARDLAFDLKAIVSGSFGSRSDAASVPVQSLAVLPFLNAAPEPETEYLSDGITESIISKLSRLANLRVMAYSTVSRFKEKEVDARQIGETLGVRSVLRGRLMQRGDTLVIRAELVNVADGSQLWGERYNRKAADLLEIEEDIAKEISERLRIRLTGEDEVHLKKRQTQSSEAYHAYLRGRFHWSKRSEADIKRGIAHFNEALEADPEYALAWVGLADSYNVSGFYSYLAPTDAYPKAEAAALKALQIDGGLSHAHASLGYVTHYYRWNWPKAEEIFRHAIEQDPSDAFAHHFYGNHLIGRGRFDEAAREFQSGLGVEPLSLIINAGLGFTYYFWRRYDRAVDQLQKISVMDDSFWLAHVWLSWAFAARSMFKEAIAEAERAMALGWTSDSVGSYAYACAAAGESARAKEALNEMIGVSHKRYVNSYYPALVSNALGDHAGALEWLERAETERSPFMTFLKVDPRFDTIRDTNAFGALVSRVGV